ncbi:hypothetical protein K469DRAFT_720441 [Zopfia rhizophila CBS 207.26]|uniref:Uncharacterized protein n=1 Tax=Zopfia rhizophila CBS 207.26 TaxID=1314779 RepID=A0A6A6EJ79_9PEZI|nr:hypothetical protein K469DRAFT_720441 [Zopfia rhizophila CBS 207.26]
MLCETYGFRGRKRAVNARSLETALTQPQRHHAVVWISSARFDRLTSAQRQGLPSSWLSAIPLGATYRLRSQPSPPRPAHPASRGHIPKPTENSNRRCLLAGVDRSRGRRSDRKAVPKNKLHAKSLRSAEAPTAYRQIAKVSSATLEVPKLWL